MVCCVAINAEVIRFGVLAMEGSEPTLFDRISKWAKNNVFIVSILCLAAAAGLLSSLIKDTSSIYDWISPQESQNYPAIPTDTGWILFGMFNSETREFHSDYAEIYRRPSDKSNFSEMDRSRTFPIKNDIIRILKERNLIINDFQSTGKSKVLNSPAQATLGPDGTLANVNYTGTKFPVGSLLEVRDVSSGFTPGNPIWTVWVRVGSAKP